MALHSIPSQLIIILTIHASMQVVDKNAPVFSLDRKITPEQTEEVIYQSIEKLMEIDNPALEMSDRCPYMF